MMHATTRLRHAIAIAAMAILFGLSVGQLRHRPTPHPEGEIEIALPIFVQVLMGFGDRFLAANLSAIRAIVTEPQRMRPDEFAVLARVQDDVSWLNPRHEDNYYTAAAVLHWFNQVDVGQRVLHRAMLTRPYDYQPGFYYAFGLYHFKHDPVAASAALHEAALGLPQYDDARAMLENLSAIWVNKIPDTDLAIDVVSAMAKDAGRRDMRRYLETRAERLRMLKQLRTAAQRYRERTGKPLQDLGTLVNEGFILALPVDPFGFGFFVNANGEVFLKN